MLADRAGGRCGGWGGGAAGGGTARGAGWEVQTELLRQGAFLRAGAVVG